MPLKYLLMNLLNIFGPSLNTEEMQKWYLDTSGRPHSIFNSADVMKLKEMQNAAMQGMGMLCNEE